MPGASRLPPGLTGLRPSRSAATTSLESLTSLQKEADIAPLSRLPFQLVLSFFLGCWKSPYSNPSSFVTVQKWPPPPFCPLDLTRSGRGSKSLTAKKVPVTATWSTMATHLRSQTRERFAMDATGSKLHSNGSFRSPRRRPKLHGANLFQSERSSPSTLSRQRSETPSTPTPSPTETASFSSP